MIIRVFCHTLSILNLISIQFKIFDKKFQEFEDDYIRFLICIFNLFVFEPICNIIQTFFIIFYIILFPEFSTSIASRIIDESLFTEL